MADNLAVTPGTGATVGADLISTVLYQRVKLIYGDDGVNSGDVSTANPFPCNVNMIGGAAFALGQQLAAASLPVVMTASQITTLTPLTTLPTVTTVGAVTAITNALPVGANVIGKVSIDQTTPGTTNFVQNSLTKVNGTTISLGSTTGSASLPVVIASDQTFKNPVPIFIAGAAGFARPADTTAYALGDLVANNTTAGSVALDTAAVAQANDQAFTILRCRLTKTSTGLTNATFRVHVYSVAAPTFANGDNGAWSSSGYNTYLGAFEVTMDKAFTDGAFGVGAPTIGPAIIGTPISGTKNIAYAVEARAAYTPGNAETFKAYFEVA